MLHPLLSVCSQSHEILLNKGSSVCDPAKIYFTSKFSYVLFCDPTHKTEIRTARRGATANSKPPGPIIMMGQSETLSSRLIIFITLFSAGAQRCCACYKPLQHMQLCAAKTIFLSQTGIDWVFFIQFYCAGSHTGHSWRCSYTYLVKDIKARLCKCNWLFLHFLM